MQPILFDSKSWKNCHLTGKPGVFYWLSLRKVVVSVITLLAEQHCISVMYSATPTNIQFIDILISE